MQNGTSTDKLATQVADFIASKGYPVNELTTANAFDGSSAHGQSEILDVGGDNQANAEMIANWLKIPIARVRAATASEKSKITGNPAGRRAAGYATTTSRSLIQSRERRANPPAVYGPPKRRQRVRSAVSGLVHRS